MLPHDAMLRIDTLLSHVWMVRTFLKHSDEAADDQDLSDVHRELYDFMLALGGPFKADDTEAYLKLARKKLTKLRKAMEKFSQLQPEISSHTNFQMAAQSLRAAVGEIASILEADPQA